METQSVTQSPELVFGLVGPIGVDLVAVHDAIADQLSKYQYASHLLHVSELMESIPTKKQIDKSSFFSKYESLIGFADEICENAKSSAALASMCVAKTRVIREKITGNKQNPALNNAFIIRQLKRPEEVQLLRKTYGRKFIQVSVTAPDSIRRKTLIGLIKNYNSQTISDEKSEIQAIQLIKMDYDEGKENFGQKMSEAFHLGDVFIDGSDSAKIKSTVEDFLRAFFGYNGSSPTKMEYGMYMATSAALRSIDLSRQVGAAIFSQAGEVQALGCNEVPKAHGGTYWAEDMLDASRDFESGLDANNKRKQDILSDLIKRMDDEGFLSEQLSGLHDSGERLDILLGKTKIDGRLILKIKNSLVMDIIEFGRMVHAEMSAITDAARLGRSIQNSIMFCTTFPCHMCAKHIVSSGIKELVYLEPYPKSYALSLHSDSISFEQDDKYVFFRPFIGIAPRRYRDIFEKKGRKDKNGDAQKWHHGEPVPMLLNDTSAAYTEEVEEHAQRFIAKAIADSTK